MSKAKPAAHFQLFRYLLAGGSAFAAEYLTFFVLFTHGHWQLYVANSVSFCVGLTVSFLLNRTWAFKQRNFKLRNHHQFALYSTLAATNLLLSNLVIGFLHHSLSIQPMLAKLCVMVGIVVWNFFIFRRLIFAPSK